MIPACPSRGCWDGSLEQIRAQRRDDQAEEVIYLCACCGKTALFKDGVLVHQSAR